jgi:hypothetical protein
MITIGKYGETVPKPFNGDWGGRHHPLRGKSEMFWGSHNVSGEKPCLFMRFYVVLAARRVNC